VRLVCRVLRILLGSRRSDPSAAIDCARLKRRRKNSVRGEDAILQRLKQFAEEFIFIANPGRGRALKAHRYGPTKVVP
jgi:hypothetical protein